MQQQFTLLPMHHKKMHFYLLVLNLKNSKTSKPSINCTLHKHLELKSTAQVKIKRFSILLSALKEALENETAWELGLKVHVSK